MFINKVFFINLKKEIMRFLMLICSVFIGMQTSGLWAEEERPNFVFILVDDLGKMDLSCEGSSFYETPHIDSIAHSAMRFDHGYSSCQVCSPSRASIQTGKYPFRVKITDYISIGRGNQPEKWRRNTRLLPAEYLPQLSLKEVTIAEALKQDGYSTFFAGKWHLGNKGFGPAEQGYDINVGGHHAGTPPGGYFSPYRNPEMSDGPIGEELPVRLGADTAKFIESHTAKDSNRPFFAMLAFYSVHGPIQTSEQRWQKYQSKAESMGLTNRSEPRFTLDRTKEVRQVQDHPVYAGMMESMDEAVGLVLEALQKSGVDDNTVVIFTSDNGGVSSGDGFATSCLPMRGGKGRQWEGGIRQPYYIKVPGMTKGQICNVPVNGTDFYPTILELAGLDLMPSQHIDGMSLVPLLRGQNIQERSLFWHYPHYGNQGGEPSSIIRKDNFKLIHYLEDSRVELYDLSKDIGEQTNIAHHNLSQVTSLIQELKSFLKQTGADHPSPNPNWNEANYKKSIENLVEKTMPNREKQHSAFLNPDFKPSRGWWQSNGK